MIATKVAKRCKNLVLLWKNFQTMAKNKLSIYVDYTGYFCFSNRYLTTHSKYIGQCK